MIKVVTHSGSFHADDVFAVAAFQLLLGKENIEVIRTRDDEVIAQGDYVVDVGGEYDHERKRYDHHQNGAPVRENGIPYAGFGLMWKHYGEAIAGSKEVADKIEEKVCLQVDAGDTGITISEMTELEVPQISFDTLVKEWRAERNTEEDMDTQFMRVVDIIREYLKRRIASETQRLKDKAYALELYEAATDKTIIVSDQPIPKSVFVDMETNVIVFPDDTPVPRWMAVAIPKTETGFETKVSFPKAWGGLRDSELQEVSGLPDAYFSHKTGFLFVAATQESAIKAARMAE